MGCGLSIIQTSGHDKVTSFDREFLDLKVQRDNLKQYEVRLQSSLKQYTELARRLLSDNERERALVVLRLKRAVEKAIQQTEVMRQNLEQVVNNIEWKQIEVDYVAQLETGNKLLRYIQKNLSLEEVEQLLDETKEASEFQRRIMDALSGYSTLETEDSSEKELEQLEAELFPLACEEPTVVTKKLGSSDTDNVTVNNYLERNQDRQLLAA
eukprot:jgi/Galph1/3055/GphlegSOOS_G1732.1